MKKLLTVLLLIACLFGCGSKDTGVKTPKSAENYVGLKWESVNAELKEAGFTQITVEEVKDIEADSIQEAGTVISVTINGSNEFTEGMSFDETAEILISYHGLKEYAADLHIDFIGNLIFSKYDVNLIIDGENIETIPHGEDRNIQKDFTVGEHKISFEKVDDASVRGELVLNVTSDLEAEYSISCENDKINVTENYIDYKAKLAEGQTKVTKSWEDFISVNYSEAVTDLEGMGFTNVSAEPIYDISLGITDEGKMAFITIDGHEDFRRGEVYNSDAEVIVKYHALKENDPKVIAEKEKQQAEEEEKAKAREEAAKKEAEEAAKKVEEEAARKEEEAAKKAEEEAERKAEEEAKKAEEAAKKAEAEAAEKKAKENLTVDNCEALREILSMHASSDSAYIEFAEKYEGRNIEFDGSVDNCSPHGSYYTRFDFLLSAGDYSTDSQIGPTFKFENKTKVDLHSDLSAVGTGMNVHIIAKVEYFDSEHEIFYLNPVEVTGR